MPFMIFILSLYSKHCKLVPKYGLFLFIIADALKIVNALTYDSFYFYYSKNAFMMSFTKIFDYCH